MLTLSVQAILSHIFELFFTSSKNTNLNVSNMHMKI